MQECKNDFYSLISQVMKLEVLYKTKQEEYYHLYNLYLRYGKDNGITMYCAKCESDSIKKQIDKIIEQISKLELDSNMQTYYNLYKKKSELLKNIWNYEAEIGYIDSAFIFDCTCDEEIDNISRNERKKLVKKKNRTIRRMQKVILDMMEIHCD